LSREKGGDRGPTSPGKGGRLRFLSVEQNASPHKYRSRSSRKLAPITFLWHKPTILPPAATCHRGPRISLYNLRRRGRWPPYHPGSVPLQGNPLWCGATPVPFPQYSAVICNGGRRGAQTHGPCYRGRLNRRKRRNGFFQRHLPPLPIGPSG